MATNEQLEQPSMAQLLEEHDVAVIPKAGDVVKGSVISVSKNEVHLDIDGLTTGVIRGRELFDESGEYSDLRIGDSAQATVLELENENNEMELSFRQAGHKKAWAELERLYKERAVVDAAIIDANRGGLMVRVGRVVGFLPVSQLTTEHYPRVEGGDKNKILEVLQTFTGQSFKVKILDLHEQEDKLIVSEKAAKEEELRELINTYKVGDDVDGVVTGVVDFGVFVEFGPKLEGLVHISELAWQRIDDPRELLKVGDRLRAKIIAVDGTKISLSVKRLQEDPWEKAVERYHVGQTVRGKVLKLNPFGAFVELDSEIHGLAHISELAETMVRNPGEILKAGETYDFKILSIDAKNHRLGLSRKALKEPEPSPEEQTGQAVAATPPDGNDAEASAVTEETAPESVTSPAGDGSAAPVSTEKAAAELTTPSSAEENG